MAVGCAVSRSSRVILVPDLSRALFSSLPFVPAVQASRYYQSQSWCRRERACRHFSSLTPSLGKEESNDSDERTRRNDTVELEYRRGLPHVLVPLPSSGRQVLFTLRPLANTVGDLVQMVKKEDEAVTTVALSTKDNVRIASSNSIANLLEEEFKLTINDTEYSVKPPDRGIKGNHLDRLTEIQTLVTQLYTTLNAGENTARLEKELQTELDTLKSQLEPLEKKKMELDQVAGRKANTLTWVGLGLMSVQFGILARLTWWEYSWDIMEPVTYFVTYGTSMAAYAYFVLTRQDYILPDVRDRQHLLHVHKKAAKIGLDLGEYNRLKDSVARVEGDLSRLRDPISRIPIQPFARPGSSHHPGDSASAVMSKVKSHIYNLFSLLRRK